MSHMLAFLMAVVLVSTGCRTPSSHVKNDADSTPSYSSKELFDSLDYLETNDDKLDSVLQMTFAQAYAQLKKQTTNAPVIIDGVRVEGMLDQLTASESAFLALGDQYPTLGAYLTANGVDVSSLTVGDFQDAVKATLANQNGAALALAGNDGAGGNLVGHVTSVSGGDATSARSPTTGPIPPESTNGYGQVGGGGSRIGPIPPESTNGNGQLGGGGSRIGPIPPESTNGNGQLGGGSGRIGPIPPETTNHRGQLHQSCAKTLVTGLRGSRASTGFQPLAAAGAVTCSRN